MSAITLSSIDTKQQNSDLRQRLKTAEKRIDTKTPTLSIVNFDNFLVEHPEELIPEQSNCKMRKPVGDIDAKPSMSYNYYGMSFVHCALTDLLGLDRLIVSSMFYPDRIISLNLANNQLLSIAGIQYACHVVTLYLHGNKLNTLEDLKPIEDLHHLKSFTVHGNPLVSCKMHRQYLIAKLPDLKKIDNNPVTEAERRHTQTLLQTPWLKIEEPNQKVK